MNIKRILGNVLVLTLIGIACNSSFAEEVSEAVIEEKLDNAATQTVVEKKLDKINKKTYVAVSSTSEADLMVAAPLANHFGTNLIFINSRYDSLPIDKNDDNLVLVGGENTLKINNLNQYKNTSRIYGKDRYETSLEVLKYLEKNGKVTGVNIVSGKKPADAVTVATSRNPVILTLDDVGGSTEKFSWVVNQEKTLSKYSRRVIGGEKSVSNTVLGILKAKRISGSDRYSTNREFVKLLDRTEAIDSYVENIVENVKLANKAFIEGKYLALKQIRIIRNGIDLGINRRDSISITRLRDILNSAKTVPSDNTNIKFDTKIIIDGSIFEIEGKVLDTKSFDGDIKIKTSNRVFVINKDEGTKQEVLDLFEKLIN